MPILVFSRQSVTQQGPNTGNAFHLNSVGGVVVVGRNDEPMDSGYSIGQQIYGRVSFSEIILLHFRITGSSIGDEVIGLLLVGHH